MAKYVPMTWTGAEGWPVVLTSTLVSEQVVVFTTAFTILPTMTSVSLITTSA
jgi:hypothetical protein